MKIIDLDYVLITPFVYQQWSSYVGFQVKELLKKYPDLKASEIPDEKFRYNRVTKKAQIFVKVRGVVISMNIAPNDYKIK